MRRREFITLFGGAAFWPLKARAQDSGAVISRIGVLWPGLDPPPPPRMESFSQGLKDSGFVPGQNVLIELRYGAKDSQQLSELASELVRLKCTVIAAFGDLGPRAVQQANSTVPVVVMSDDVIGSGLITSLSRPGGNTTGITIQSPELSAKRLELLTHILPGISRVAAIWDPTTGVSQVSMTEQAARALKIKVQVLEVRRREDLAGAFLAAKAEKAQALNVFSSPFLSSISQEILDAAAENRLPAIYQWREHAEAGGLISYGPSLADLWRQTAIIVVKILKGAKPADLPVEQPTKFELVVNAKTASSLGFIVPPDILLRSDHVIE
jgi:putative tryptophan/tyrosine transport system substrate-binding protein